MIVVIRIAGMVEIPKTVAQTLDRMRLRQKYAAIILEDNPENRKLLLKVRNFVAYGKINHALMEMLLMERGERFDKKEVDAKKIVAEMPKKSLEDLGVKPFFRLHPPRKGIDSRKHYGVGKGVLGDHGENIGKLLERML